MSTCFRCGPGRFASGLANVGCESCVPGKFSSGGRAECEVCPEQTVARLAGATECVLCVGLSLPNAASTACLCGVGFFATDGGGC